MIVGTVRSGQGGASRAMTGARLQERTDAAGVPLVPGTLNVDPVDLDHAREKLGEPAFATDHASRIGPLRWWPVWVVTGPLRAPGWIVRHDRTGTDYLEVVSDVHFRDAGVEDGDVVMLEARG